MFNSNINSLVKEVRVIELLRGTWLGLSQILG